MKYSMMFQRFRFLVTPQWASRLSIVGALLLISASANAQSRAQAGGEDERVQELYAQAKSAQAAGNLPEAAARYEAILKIAPGWLRPTTTSAPSIYGSGNFVRRRKFCREG